MTPPKPPQDPPNDPELDQGPDARVEEPPTETAHGASGKDPDAADELRSALRHVRSAAGILLSRATRDPAVRNASAEAGRRLSRLGATAEPVARQMGAEAGRALERLGTNAERVARGVASEAERLGAQLEAEAEPVAEQMADELARFTKKMADVVKDGVEVGRSLLEGSDPRRPKG